MPQVLGCRMNMEEGKSSGRRSLRESLQEYGRGVAGGLLFSVPLLYTMEIWWAGFRLGPCYLLAYIGTTFLLLLGYNRFAGMRKDASYIEVCIDSIEEMGMGLLMATLTLFLLGQITAEMPLPEILGKIVVESMTVAVGISVGTSQLGAGTSSDSGLAETQKSDGHAQTSDTLAQLMLAFCGAMLFAANVGPTDEIETIAVEAGSFELLGLAALSLLIGAVILLYSAFVRAEVHTNKDGIFGTILGVVSSYAVALAAAALLLWFFRGLGDEPPVICISQIVVLAFPAMLGASAGRLLIQ